MTNRTFADLESDLKIYNSNLVLQILRKDYPEVDLQIRQRIDADIPAKIYELEYIPDIIKSFIALREIEDLVVAISRYGSKEIWENVDLLLSVIMLFYHPEKVMQLTDEKLRYGVMGIIARELQCSNKLLQRRVSQVIVSFKAYRGFREETYRLYGVISITNNLLKS